MNQRKSQNMAVIGGGTMGGGIAMNFANAGIPVTVADNAGRPRIRSLASAMRSAPRRTIKHRIRADFERASVWSVVAIAAYLCWAMRGLRFFHATLAHVH